MISKEQIIDDYVSSFDPGEPLNGSLYLGIAPTQYSESVLLGLINKLRDKGLWSEQDYKQIADEQKSAYKEQLEFVDFAAYEVDGVEVILSRFDHPKFPSSAERWHEWCAFFEAGLQA